MRRVLAAGGLLPLLLGSLLLVAPGALGDDRTRSTTRGSMTLTVTPATGLEPGGRVVRVTGRGYDVNKGVYVAFCVDNGPGKTPTPCGGGQDRAGTSGNSVWISSVPPYYGTGLAQPYGEGGTFDVTIRVQASLKDGVDCRTVRCAVVTRADHTASDDRSLDVAVPVDFTSTSPRIAAPGSTAGRSPQPGPADSQQATAPPATADATPTAAASATVPATSATPSTEPPRGGGPEVPASVPAAAERSGDGDGVGAPALLGLLGVGVSGAATTTLLLRRRRTR